MATLDMTVAADVLDIFVNMQHADLSPVAVSKPFTGAILSIRRVEYDIEREIKGLGQSGLPRADWIAKRFWPPRRRCHSLHSNDVLNRGYAYATIISSKYHGQTLLSHLASLYPHSTPQASQQN